MCVEQGDSADEVEEAEVEAEEKRAASLRKVSVVVPCVR